MRLPTRLRAQALALFLGVAGLYAAFSPLTLRAMGYAAETMGACEQLLSTNRPRVPPDFGVDWPRNGSTEVFLLCPFQTLGRALAPRSMWWPDRFASMQPVAATAAIVTLVFVWASRLASSRRRAFWLALGAGFCTMLWPYAYIGMEPVQSLFLLLSGYLALEAPPDPSVKRTTAFSLCAAIAVASKSGGIALVPAVLFLAWVLLRRRPLRLAVALAPVAALFLLNNHFRALSWERFGGFEAWSAGIRIRDVASSILSGVALLVSPNKGLLVFAPLAILGLALLHKAFRRDPKVAAFALLSLAGPLLLATQFRIWSDETWGPRYLHCAVAPLILCVASVIRGRRPSVFLRALIGAAAVAGLGVSFLGSMFHYGQLSVVALRAAPTSLQAYQGDPTWNHVAFDARLLKVWWRMQSGNAAQPEVLPAPDAWVSPDPSHRPPWSSFDLRQVAIPQPMLLRSFPADDSRRAFRPIGAALLAFGAILLLFADRAAAAADKLAKRTFSMPIMPPAPAASALPLPPLPAPSPAEIYDGLVERIGFDVDHPGWFPALRELHRHSRTRRLQLIPDFFYTSVFAPADLPASVWDGTFTACGVWDLARQKRFLQDTPAFLEDLALLKFEPHEDASVYHWGNEQFSHADAALYHALIRRFRPKRLVEVGAGHSTKLAVKALRENGAGTLLCIDPHAPSWLRKLDGPIEIREERVQAAADELFLGLEPNDILFIDGSHISKTGSDVNHLFLRILPRLPPGVVVHIHDICLPYEYPKNWSEDVLCYWNEQYVLAALLANSAKYEILVGVYFVQRQDHAALRRFVPNIPGIFPGGGSLWMRTLT